MSLSAADTLDTQYGSYVQPPLRAMWIACALLSLVLAAFGWLWAAVAIVGLAVAAVFSPWLLSWSTILSLLTITILLVPANLYRLPASLPFDVEVYRLFVLALFSAWAVALLTDGSVRIRRTFLDVNILVAVVAVVISFAVNVWDFEPVLEFSQSAKAVVYVLTFFALYYCIVSVVSDNRLASRLVHLLVYLAAAAAVLGVVERTTGYNVFKHLHEYIPLLEPSPEIGDQIYRGGIRVSGPTSHPIAFGTLLALVLPLPIEFVLESKTLWERVRWVVLSVLIMVGALLTVSRTAFVGIAAVLLGIAATRPKQRGALLLCAALVAVGTHMFFPGVIGRFVEGLTPSRVIQREVAAGEESRLADYPRIAKEVSRKPLVGRGVGTFTAERFFFVDNQYLKYLAEIGLLGLASMVLLFVSAAGGLLRRGHLIGGHPGAIVSGVGISAIVYALVNATFDAQGFPQVPYLFYLLLGLGVATALNSEENRTTATEAGRHGRQGAAR